MNLRIDLILETEQRSGSVVSLKSLIRMALIVVPLMIGLAVAWQIFGFMRVKGEYRSMENQWKTVEPLEKRAKQLTLESRANESLVAELNGWKKSHMDWNSHLLLLLGRVPGNIQLVNLRLSQILLLVDEKAPARDFTIVLGGRAFGEDAESSVTSLKHVWESDPAFTNDVKKVEVAKFGEDATVGAGKTDRSFELRCSYRERLFK